MEPKYIIEFSTIEPEKLLDIEHPMKYSLTKQALLIVEIHTLLAHKNEI